MKIITAYDLGAEIARRQVAVAKTAADLGAIAAIKQAAADLSGGAPPPPKPPAPGAAPQPPTPPPAWVAERLRQAAAGQAPQQQPEMFNGQPLIYTGGKQQIEYTNFGGNKPRYTHPIEMNNPLNQFHMQPAEIRRKQLQPFLMPYDVGTVPPIPGTDYVPPVIDSFRRADQPWAVSGGASQMAPAGGTPQMAPAGGTPQKRLPRHDKDNPGEYIKAIADALNRGETNVTIEGSDGRPYTFSTIGEGTRKIPDAYVAMARQLNQANVAGAAGGAAGGAAARLLPPRPPQPVGATVPPAPKPPAPTPPKVPFDFGKIWAQEGEKIKKRTEAAKAYTTPIASGIGSGLGGIAAGVASAPEQIKQRVGNFFADKTPLPTDPSELYSPEQPDAPKQPPAPAPVPAAKPNDPFKSPSVTPYTPQVSESPSELVDPNLPPPLTETQKAFTGNEQKQTDSILPPRPPADPWKLSPQDQAELERHLDSTRNPSSPEGEPSVSQMILDAQKQREDEARQRQFGFAPPEGEPPAPAAPPAPPPVEEPPRIQGQALPPSQYQQRYAPPQQNPYFSPPQPQPRRGLFGRRR